MKSRTHLKSKEVDDVLGGEESWGNQTNGTLLHYSISIFAPYRNIIAPCPKCDNPMAHFMELQIRSADEPMTICTCLSTASFFVFLICVSQSSSVHAGNVAFNGKKTEYSRWRNSSLYSIQRQSDSSIPLPYLSLNTEPKMLRQGSLAQGLSRVIIPSRFSQHFTPKNSHFYNPCSASSARCK